jgi:hypothetical protein
LKTPPKQNKTKQPLSLSKKTKTKTKTSMGNAAYNAYTWSTGYSPLVINATGDWRYYKDKTECLQSMLGIGFEFEVISQEDEARGQALCAHRIMREQGYIDQIVNSNRLVGIPLPEFELFLYIGAGRGSTQITIIDLNGNVVEIYMGPGYPKRKGGGDKKSTIEDISAIVDKIHLKYGRGILGIFGFDSIFHVLKKTCPVVADKSKLPDTITTTGEDFRSLGYLASHYPNTPMLVFRNFIMKDGKDRKVTFLHGKKLKVDLGTAQARLTNPESGEQIYVADLPDNWQTDETHIDKIVEIMNYMKDQENKYSGN